MAPDYCEACGAEFRRGDTIVYTEEGYHLCNDMGCVLDWVENHMCLSAVLSAFGMVTIHDDPEAWETEDPYGYDAQLERQFEAGRE